MRITEHFSLSEFTSSDTAKRRKIDNTPTDSAIVNIVNLCANLLEPLRIKYGSAITISSGYRSPALNRAVGGANDSQHMRGEAADIKGRTVADNMRLFHLIRELNVFDQVIAEEYDPHTGNCAWVHVSMKINGENRHRALVKYKGRKGYFDWK